MTEPNEPKIVHFSPRAQAPVQDTAGNWEPDEQLFGLEELLQQLPQAASGKGQAHGPRAPVSGHEAHV